MLGIKGFDFDFEFRSFLKGKKYDPTEIPSFYDFAVNKEILTDP